MRLRKRAAEILRQPQRSAEYANVRGDRSCQRTEPAKPTRVYRVSKSDDEQRIGNAIRNLVVERARYGLPFAFDSDHAVEQVAEQSRLHSAVP
jgi:hypothetical protein